MPICLHVFSGHFHTMVMELSSCNRNRMPCKGSRSNSCLALHGKGMQTPILATWAFFSLLEESKPVPTSGPLLLLFSLLGMLLLYNLCSDITPSFSVHISPIMLIMISLHQLPKVFIYFFAYYFVSST